MKIGDKLICSNQGSGGGDVDIFKVRKAGICPTAISHVIALGTGQLDPVVERQVQVTFTGFIANGADLKLGKTRYVNLCANTTVEFNAVDPLPLAPALPTVSFATTASNVAEGTGANTTISIEVTLSDPSSDYIVVPLSIGGSAISSDYAYSGSLTGNNPLWVYFYPGTKVATINLSIVGDEIDEENETVVLTLSYPDPPTTNPTYTLGANQYALTITNDDPKPKVAFGSPTSAVWENGGGDNIPVTLSQASGKTVSVAYAVTSGASGGEAKHLDDFILEINGSAAPSLGLLTFAPGVTTQFITVKALNDGVVESTEKISFMLSAFFNADLGTQTTHHVDLYDSISPNIDAADTTSLSIWYCGPGLVAGGCTVSTDNSFKQAGDSSIKIQAPTTQTANSVFWAGFPVTPNLNWNVSPYLYMDFWLHVEPVGDNTLFLNDSALRIGTGSPNSGNYYEFKPTQGYDIFASAVRPLSKEWIFFRVPLAGSVAWQRSAIGAPNLADVDYIEFHLKQSSGQGFNAWVDGIRFSKTGTLPPTPPPPPGVDKDAIESKVLVVSFNPILDEPMPPGYTAPPRVNEYINDQLRMPILEDPVMLAQRFKNTIFKASAAKANYKIADILIMDAWPVFTKKGVESQSNDGNFLTQHCPPGGQRAGDCYLMRDQQTELARVARMLGLGERAMTGEIDEVHWIEYQPAPGENAMFGEGTFSINGQVAPPPFSTSTRAVPIANFACLECQGHRIESILKRMFGSSKNKDIVYDSVDAEGLFLNPLPSGFRPGSTEHAWERFTMIDKQVDRAGSPRWIGAIGNAHFPVNAQGNYDFRNSSNTVPTNADDWLKYPNMTCKPSDYDPSGAWRQINCSEWNCAEQESYADNGKLLIRGYQTWLLEHLPHATGVNPGRTCGDPASPAPEFPLDVGLLNNWWRYLMDIDQFKWRDGRFNADWTPPTVTINALEQLIQRDSIYDQWVPRPPVKGDPAQMPTRVHGHVGVKVQVTDENPIYRVDLYVNGQYKLTDTLRPYTFDWDATNLSGPYTLEARAYDMPNGFEGVSTIEVTVDPVSNVYTPTILLYNPSAILPASPFIKNGETVATSIGAQPVHLWVSGYYLGQTITYSAQNLPTGAYLNETTGEFTWTPVTGDYGAQWIRFIATNRAGDSRALEVVIAVADPLATEPP